MSPLREALARLAGDQLVKTEDQRGFWVAPLSLDELDDISRVRTLVETEALRLSIENGDEAWERGVRGAFEALSEVERDLPAVQQPIPQETLVLWEERNHAFHTALIAACLSVAPPQEAALAGAAWMSLASERAARDRRGPARYRMAFIDELSTIHGDEIAEHLGLR